jgi:hypothetical protein
VYRKTEGGEGVYRMTGRGGGASFHFFNVAVVFGILVRILILYPSL